MKKDYSNANKQTAEMFAATLEKARSPRRMQTVEAGGVDVMSRAGQDDWSDERLDFIEALESQKCYLTPEDLKYISNSICLAQGPGYCHCS